MALFLPTVAVTRVTDITPELLQALQVKAVLLDVDNTLAPHGSQKPFLGAVEWVHFIQKAGFRIVIMSNNFKKRVAPFAAQFELPFLSLSIKPLPLAYHRAAHRLRLRPSDVVSVGDQIFTDVIGANISGMKSILLSPVEEETSWSLKIKRFFEKPFRAKIKKIK